MNEWITDRRPTKKDCAGVDRVPHSDHVWVMHEGKVTTCPFGDVVLGCPWQPMVVQMPEPYVKPKSYVIKFYGDFEIVGPAGYACVYDTIANTQITGFLPREAAERIAAIYEEVLP